MSAKPIINYSSKYVGKYVATDSFNDKTVVASGNDPDQVRQKAIKKGHKKPIITFVPDKKTIHIY